MATRKERILALAAKGRTGPQIAAAVGGKLNYVHQVKCREKKPDFYRNRSREQQEKMRRKAGLPTRAEIKAARDAKIAAIAPLLKKGVSWRKTAKRLGISHNIISGLVFRNKERLGL